MNYTMEKVSKKDLVLVSILILTYGIFFSLYTLARHYNFYSNAFDLGIFDQTMWSIVKHGNMITTVERISPVSHLAIHFSPILYLLAPFYWLYSKAQTLLVLQSFILGLAALPIYLLAKQKTNNIALSLIICASYLLYPPLHYVNQFDFHAIALAAPLLMFTLYFLETEQYKTFCLFLILSLLVKEDVALSGVVIGLYLIFAKKQKWFGLVVAIFCLLYFFIITGIVMPKLAYPAVYNDTARYSNLLPQGKGYGYILISMLKHPIYVFKHIFFNKTKLMYLFKILLPVLFLPLFNRISAILLLIPSLFVNLLSNYPPQYSIHAQYTAEIMPFIYFLTILGVCNVTAFFTRQRETSVFFKKKEIIKYMPVFIGIVILIANGTYGMFQHIKYRKVFNFTNQHNKILHSIIAEIPNNASVCTMTSIIPHLSARDKIFFYPYITGADYIILDTAKTANYWPSYRTTYLKKLKPILEQKQYGVVKYKNDCLLLKKNYNTVRNRKVLMNLGLVQKYTHSKQLLRK